MANDVLLSRSAACEIIEVKDVPSGGFLIPKEGVHESLMGELMIRTPISEFVCVLSVKGGNFYEFTESIKVEYFPNTKIVLE